MSVPIFRNPRRLDPYSMTGTFRGSAVREAERPHESFNTHRGLHSRPKRQKIAVNRGSFTLPETTKSGINGPRRYLRAIRRGGAIN